jgi:hypothetical protein
VLSTAPAEVEGTNHSKEVIAMKKLMIATLSVLTVLVFCFPATATDIDNNTSNVTFGGDAQYDMSNRVFVDYSIDVPTNAQSFGISTVHSGGNRMFATTSETSVLWYMTVDKGNTTPLNIDETWTTGQFESDTAWNSL